MFSVLFLCMYHRRHLLVYLTHWLNGNFFKKKKKYLLGKGEGRCLLPVSPEFNGFVENQLELISNESVIK